MFKRVFGLLLVLYAAMCFTVNFTVLTMMGMALPSWLSTGAALWIWNPLGMFIVPLVTGDMPWLVGDAVGIIVNVIAVLFWTAVWFFAGVLAAIKG